MRLKPNVFDVWTFQRQGSEIRFLLLHSSEEKARRHFGGGRFWQIPSGVIEEGEGITDAVTRVLGRFALDPMTIWAAEHTYIIYNRRFAEMQLIGVYAAEVTDAPVSLDPTEHAEHAWLTYEECLARVHYRGLKDGLRSVQEYVTGPDTPAPELRLFP